MKPEDQVAVKAPAGASRERLRQLVVDLRRLRATLRYVDYRQAERDVEILAERIRRTYSAREIRELSFMAIPRGGCIVLGMLSYQLSLGPRQLRPPPDPGRPLMLVDDCALTGARFAAELEAAPSARVDFAHLYSLPRLRQAIVSREPRVTHCLAAHDLADHSRSFFPGAEDHRDWRGRWRARLGPERYWYGIPDLICFAWSEPDRPFWNSASERVETGWRFLAPHRCLKNRERLVGSMPANGEWQVPDGVGIGDFEDEIWLCHMDTEQVFALEGAAADIWRLLAGGVPEDRTVAELCKVYQVGRDALHGDLKAFVSQLVANGLLRPAGETRQTESVPC